MRNPNIESLLTKLLGQAKTDALFSTLNMPAILEEWEDGVVTRAEIAQAMNMALFEGLLERSANGRAYTADAIESGGSVYFDHGALRTVRWPHTGALPPGEAAFTRILRPLGFRLNGRYPLDKLGMVSATGSPIGMASTPDNEVPETQADVDAFEEQFNVTWPSAFDQSLTVAKTWGFGGFPGIYIVDAKGTIRYVHSGEIDEKTLVAEIQKAGG